MKKKILICLGTRPEAIKLAPLIGLLKKQSKLEYRVLVTGQHKQMLKQVLEVFNIKPDYDLKLMKNEQVISDLMSMIIKKVGEVIYEYKPDLVLVHGDTATTIGSSLAAYSFGVKIAHVEAGLRTDNLYSPWPEEGNRRLTGAITNMHFAPTLKAKNNLLKENIQKNKITVTGNTVIDCLFDALEIINKTKNIKKYSKDFDFIDESKKIILVTGHRRESFGIGFENICKALKKIAENLNVQIIYPVHLNPNVVVPVNRFLGNIKNINLIKPLDYLPFIYLMNKSDVILTDSGGIQEEAPSLGKPVLVLRDTTERPEAVEAGTVKLVGTDKHKIFKFTKRLIENKKFYDDMSFAHNPYGDGKASKRILKTIIKKL